MSSKKILCTLALGITSTSATQWQLTDTYDKTNFFDKFDFFSKEDPTSGHVNYRTREDATKLGLIGIEGNDIFMRPDTSSTVGDEGRSSVRIESKKAYDHGLFIAKFSKVLTPTCGVWPAFWTYGEPWVEVGEVDIIEQWHNRSWNQPAVHTGRSSEFGECKIEQTDMRATVLTDNCDNSFNSPPSQFENQGCTVRDDSGPWGSCNGAGVYAMEWTSEVLKLYSFTGGNVPTNIDSESPDTVSWGKPMLTVKNDKCDIDEHFARQRLVFNIDFCGNPARDEQYWVEDSKCASSTGYKTCEEYVGNEPGDFKDAFYKIQDIRVFKEESAEPTRDPGPTADPTKDPEPTADPTEDPEPTSQSTPTEPTADPTEDPERTADPTGDSEWTFQPTGAESAGPEPTEDCDDDETMPTSRCNGDNCPEEPTAAEPRSPTPAEDCDEDKEPEPTSSYDDDELKPISPCDGVDCAEPTASESEALEPTGCEGDCPEGPTSIESEFPAEPTEDEYEEPGCRGPGCPNSPDYSEEPLDSSSPVFNNPNETYPEPEEPAPGCSGLECSGSTGSNGTDVGGLVQVGAGVRAGVSLVVVGLVTFLAL